MICFSVELPIHIALVVVRGVRVTREDAGFERLGACAASYRDRYGGADDGTPPSAVSGVQHARELFRALDIDATRRRPSSESLLNRVLKDKPLPRVNSLVDVGNACSLSYLLPLGLYDCARLHGAVTLRRGGDGESYPAIGNKTINLEGRYLLADDGGPFGSPMTDSVRTAVSDQTTETAIFIYAPWSYERDLLARHAEFTGSEITAVCGGCVEQNEIISGT